MNRVAVILCASALRASKPMGIFIYKEIAPKVLDIEAHRADLLVDEYARMGFEARRADILVEKHTRMRFEGRSPDFLVETVYKKHFYT